MNDELQGSQNFGPTPSPELVEALHKQNTDHDRHGYDTFKQDCPTCDLLGKLIVGAAIVKHAEKDDGHEGGGVA